MENVLTEIGRRLAIFAGTTALTLHVLVGLISNGDIVDVLVRGIIAGIIFGLSGLVVGNLIQGYILNAAKREMTRKALEKELRKKMAAGEEELESPEGETEFGVEPEVESTG